MTRLAHIAIHRGRFIWSGYLASGDPRHAPHAHVIEVGRDFWIGDDGKLCFVTPGRRNAEEFTPESLIVAARAGFYGLQLLVSREWASRQRDRTQQARPKDRRRRQEPAPC